MRIGNGDGSIFQSAQISIGVNFMEYQIGDIVKTKKQHPCGSQEWEICIGCNHVIMIPREKALKIITKKI